jgi:hypothetical protein
LRGCERSRVETPRGRGVARECELAIGRYIANLVCHEARLIVEIDGGQHDRSSPREAERSGFLQNQGYRMGAVYGMLLHVSTLAAGNITPSQPSPIKGEGFCQVSAHSIKPFHSKNIIPVT